MSNQVVKRGYVPTDNIEFNEESLYILKQAQIDLAWLMERGYPIKSVSTFVGNHYMLSERQRLALVRATCDTRTLEMRKGKCVSTGLENSCVYIDALNIIITLEVALSESTLLYCMDETIRDLAGLRGTYHLIDKTTTAIELIGKELSKLKIREAVFYLDSPVSNTGRLKLKIQELLADHSFTVGVELVNNADTILEKKEHVITSDSIILNKCISWINLTRVILSDYIPCANLLNFRMYN